MAGMTSSPSLDSVASSSSGGSGNGNGSGSRFNRLLSKLASSNNTSSDASTRRPSPVSSAASSSSPSLRTSIDQYRQQTNNNMTTATTPVRYTFSTTRDGNLSPTLMDTDEMTPLRPPVFESRFMRELEAGVNPDEARSSQTSTSTSPRPPLGMSYSSPSAVHAPSAGQLQPKHTRSPSVNSIMSYKTSSNRSSTSASSTRQPGNVPPSSYRPSPPASVRLGRIPSISELHNDTSDKENLPYHQQARYAELPRASPHQSHRKTASLMLETTGKRESPGPLNADKVGRLDRDHLDAPHDVHDIHESIPARSHSSLGFRTTTDDDDVMEGRSSMHIASRPLKPKDVNSAPLTQDPNQSIGVNGTKFGNFARSASNALGSLTRKRSIDGLSLLNATNCETKPVSGSSSSWNNDMGSASSPTHNESERVSMSVRSASALGISDVRNHHPLSALPPSYASRPVLGNRLLSNESITDVSVPVSTTDGTSLARSNSQSKSTPGFPRVPLGASTSTTATSSTTLASGLSESSKRFRSAFRLNKNRMASANSTGEQGGSGTGMGNAMLVGGVTPGMGMRRAMRVPLGAQQDAEEEDGSDNKQSPDDNSRAMRSLESNSSGNGYVTNLSNITDVSPPAQGVDVGERLRKGDTSTAMMALRDSAQERAQLVSTSSYDISVSARGPSMPQEQEAESTQSRTDNQADAHSDTLVPADTRDGRRTRAAAGNNEYRVYSDQEGADEVEVILDIAQPTTTDNDVNQDKENNHVDQRYAAAALTKTSMPLLGAADLRNSRTADRHVLGEVKRLLQPQVSNVDVLSAKLPSLSLEGRQHTQVPFSQPLPQPPQRIGKSSSSSSNGGYGYHPADRQIISNDYAVPTKQSGDTPPDSHSAASYAAAYRPAPGLPLQHLAQLPHKSAVHSATAASEQPAPTASRKTAGLVTVKGKTYTRMGLLGKGGSSKVFRVSDREHQIFALKKVDLGKGADSETYQAFLNEIDLLERLKGHDRIIQLVASEVNEARRSLIMVMEIGEIDMNALLQERQGKRVSMNFIRHTWEQMLEAVNVIHDVGIVHTDLKPANFVLVKGALKLIDFGIAKAIPNDTTNIARDQQIGTANYMSPEALSPHMAQGPRGERVMKLGRPSDVWSLGCILYQIVYGHTPFGRIKNLAAKMAAIQTPGFQIDFPAQTIPITLKGEPLRELAVMVEDDLLRCMKNCLRYDPKKRATIPQLLEDPFLRNESSSCKLDSSNKPRDNDADESPIDPETIAHIISKTLQWSQGRLPSRNEQERFVEAIVRQIQHQTAR